MEILIFKTTVMNSDDVMVLADGLTHLVGKNNWTIDIEDCDKVLRLQAKIDITTQLEHLLAKHGFYCETLK
ncbi:hypothetical protein SAMN05518672_101398 [Chitinophaga sp. CF118]|uniref:hypothetical protein n=1 Tax=Chitinophaga sp. CF118 TaxID=1884367 RepID=UPI0008EB55EB|nr:hypothetical protein [Chitinophaga sp. CF118]SFD08707.1 hypothetical protein SAMN05518672_101398 [Chitinophaga sp. CF118]